MGVNPSINFSLVNPETMVRDKCITNPILQMRIVRLSEVKRHS